MFDRRNLTLRIVATIVFALLSATLGILFERYATTDLEKWLLDVTELVVASAGATLIFARVLWRLRGELSLLIRYHDLLHNRVGSSPITAVILGLLRPGLEKEMNRLVQLVDVTGLSLSRDELPGLTKSAFELCRGPYIGTDKNLPSAFRAIYPQYLEDQIRRSRGRFSEDVRFLIVEPEELRRDYENDNYEFRMFYNLHWVNQVQLLQVDPSHAELARKKTQLPSGELGLYGWKYVLFYSPAADGSSVRVYARPLADPLTGECQQFLEELVSYAKLVSLPTNRAPVLTNPNDEYREHLRTLLASSSTTRRGW